MKPEAASVARSEQRHDQHQYLTFMLGKETFALGILGIKEILEYTIPTDVPMMPAFIRGVVNLRGAVVPVIDMAVRFGRPPGAVTKKTCIVIMEVVCSDANHVLGILVDSVSEVLEIPASEIELPPSFGATIRTDFMRGMGKVRGKFVIILDENRVLSVDEMESLTQQQAAVGT
jgi:purine-binding chemotaxis protein CheW